MSVQNIKSSVVITSRIGDRLTDHRAVVMKCNIHVPCRGNNHWKFNTSILYDENYCKFIRDIIHSTYNDVSLDGVSASVKWYVLKLRIKEISIRTGIRKANKVQNELSMIENEIDDLSGGNLSII